MKKIVLGLLLAVQLSSCASMMQDGMPKTAYQSKPVTGHRKIQVFPFIADVLFVAVPLVGVVPLIVDFWDGRIYRQYPKGYHTNDITSKTN
jgi:hypothetical protein